MEMLSGTVLLESSVFVSTEIPELTSATYTYCLSFSDPENFIVADVEGDVLLQLTDDGITIVYPELFSNAISMVETEGSEGVVEILLLSNSFAKQPADAKANIITNARSMYAVLLKFIFCLRIQD